MGNIIEGMTDCGVEGGSSSVGCEGGGSSGVGEAGDAGDVDRLHCLGGRFLGGL